ncbi:MAG: DUF222 domain-containing protein [Acidimicrobiia bacterium]
MFEMVQDTVHIDVTDMIHPGLDEMEPGPIMAAFVSAVDVDTLSGHDRVVALRAHSRLATHFAAQAYRDMVAIKDVMPDYDGGSGAAIGAATEVRAALRLTRHMADAEMLFALDLQERLPQVFEMLMSGSIDVRRAKVIVDATCHLSEASAQDVVQRIAEAASDMTTGQLRAHIRGLCIEANPDDAEEVYERSVEERGVEMQPDVNGTAHLKGTHLPPDRVLMATERINQMAKRLRGKGETRTMDQLRADVFLDLLTGAKVKSSDGSPVRDTVGGGGVTLSVDVDTLAALNNHHGDLAGYGPVIADVARQFAESHHRSQWQWAVTDTETGRPIATGTTRRRPNIETDLPMAPDAPSRRPNIETDLPMAAGTTGRRSSTKVDQPLVTDTTRRRPLRQQQRNIEISAPTCVFPGCRVPSRSSDIDHRIPYSEGGATDESNLQPLCRHDHGVRHEFGWSYEVDQRGNVTWTSPLHHSYATFPNVPAGTPP